MDRTHEPVERRAARYFRHGASRGLSIDPLLVPISRTVERVIAVCGVALIAAAAAARQPWLDRHFLPSFFMPRIWYVAIETVVRIGIAAAGAALVFGRSRLARLLIRAPTATIQVAAE